MTEREKTPADANSLPSTSGETSAQDAGRPTKIGVYDNPSNAGTKNQKLVGMYDRPERAGPAPMLLIVAALVVLALIIALLYYFIF